MKRRWSRVFLALASVLPVVACASPSAAPAAQPPAQNAQPAPQNQLGGGSSRAAARPQVTATAVPPTPTAVPPTPTPIPEPRTYATSNGGQFFAETGFGVQDEPNGPRFWTEYQRQGGVAALGLPTTRVYDAPDQGRVQQFQKGWLSGTAGQAAVRRGDGAPPDSPPEARAAEDRPEMAFIGRVDVQPKEVKQGSTVMFRIWSQSAQSATLRVEGRDIPMARQGDALVALWGPHRQAALGVRPVQFTIVDQHGRRTVRNDSGDSVRVVDAGFPTEDLTVTDDTLGILDPNEVNKEEAIMNGVEAKWTPERLWEGPFEGPVGDVSITSDFGTKRFINGVDSHWEHEGTDFDVQVGDPIHAAADGRVVFAGPLHVRGNVVVIDHGLGVFTGYFHQSQIQVQVGQDVRKGDVIGLVGSTGFVTGPHLHFEVRVQNVCVEPMEWLSYDARARLDLANV